MSNFDIFFQFYIFSLITKKGKNVDSIFVLFDIFSYYPL